MAFMTRTEMIKIKFGDTIMRMKPSFYEYCGSRVEIRTASMIELRTKIRDLFKFPADADFILTYVDEERDVVTLINNDGLSDAFQQRMKVLKINVQLCNNKGVGSHSQSGGSSINSTQRLTSLQTQHPHPKIKTSDVLAEVSKSVLQLLRDVLLVLHEALSKISEDTVSKAVLSDPLLVDLISKTAQTYLNLHSQTHSGMVDSTKINVDHDNQED